MIELLFVAVVVAAVVSLWDAAVVFAVLCIAHDVVFGRFDGLIYFGSAGAFDLACLVILGFCRYNVPRVMLQALCIVSMSINYSGWAMWYNGYDGDLYQSMMAGVYVLAILIMAWSLKNGNPGASGWSFLLRFLNRSSSRVLDKD